MTPGRMHDSKPPDFQTIGQCEKTHRTTRWAIGLLLTLLVALIGTTVTAASISWRAASKVEAVDRRVEAMDAAGKERTTGLERLLNMIHERLGKVEDGQTRILRELPRGPASDGGR